jgi:hypothetical protein
MKLPAMNLMPFVVIGFANYDIVHCDRIMEATDNDGCKTCIARTENR